MPTVDEINRDLKTAKIGVRVELRGDALSLRATLPPKPGSDRTEPHQQRISLGIYANPAGLKRAKAEAIALGGLLATKQFDWKAYLGEPVTTGTAGEWITKFEQHYFEQRKRNPKSESTFKASYAYIFRKFDPEKKLDKRSLLDVVVSTEPDSRNRQQCCLVLGMLAKFAEIEVDLAPYRGKYTPKERQIPKDEEIYAGYAKISPTWQWIYGIVATFGLRPHEAFYVDLNRLDKDTPRIYILDGKTGSRSVWAFPAQWWYDWELWNPKMPKVTARNNQDYGHRIVQQFNKKQMGFRPYDLRHAWAIRTLFAGLEITIAAQQMGHSVSVHADTYHRWISEKQHEEAWRRLNQS